MDGIEDSFFAKAMRTQRVTIGGKGDRRGWRDTVGSVESSEQLMRVREIVEGSTGRWMRWVSVINIPQLDLRPVLCSKLCYFVMVVIAQSVSSIGSNHHLA